jgi:hypothetical protein
MLWDVAVLVVLGVCVAILFVVSLAGSSFVLCQILFYAFHFMKGKGSFAFEIFVACASGIVTGFSIWVYLEVIKAWGVLLPTMPLALGVLLFLFLLIKGKIVFRPILPDDE